MLSSISWQQFICAALILTAFWYIGVFIYLYRTGSVSLKPPQIQQLKKEWDEDLEEEQYGHSDLKNDLIGKSAMPDGVSEVGMEEIQFLPQKHISAPQPEVSETLNSKGDQLGLIPDVLHELKSAFYMVKMEDGSKEDLLTLFGYIRERYAELKGLRNPDYLIEFIAENSPIILTDDEIRQLFS